MSKKREPGRPKSDEKRDSILESAKNLFLKKGYSQTSIEQIAKKAGVVKPTVYSHFGSKESLFQEIINLRQKNLLENLAQIANPSENPQADLEKFGLSLGGLILEKDARLWDRLVIAEAGRSPQLAQMLYKAGPLKVCQLLENYLQKQVDVEILQIEDVKSASEELCSLIVGLDILRGQMISISETHKNSTETRIKAGIRLFLKGYGYEFK